MPEDSCLFFSGMPVLRGPDQNRSLATAACSAPMAPRRARPFNGAKTVGKVTMTNTINTVIRKIPNWLIYLIGAAYPAWLLYAGFSGALGVDPVKSMEHALGQSGASGAGRRASDFAIAPLHTA